MERTRLAAAGVSSQQGADKGPEARQGADGWTSLSFLHLILKQPYKVGHLKK